MVASNYTCSQCGKPVISISSACGHVKEYFETHSRLREGPRPAQNWISRVLRALNVGK